MSALIGACVGVILCQAVQMTLDIEPSWYAVAGWSLITVALAAWLVFYQLVIRESA